MIRTMARDWFESVTESLGQIRDKAAEVVDKAAEAVSDQQASFVRGKVAGKTVMDDSGVVIVEAGHVIDDSAIERAASAGKMHLLTSTVVTAKAQDFKEKAQDAFAQTDSGQENRSLNSVDQYVEARRYIGRYTGMDVTDIRGAVLIPMGKQINDQDVAFARESGQLGALIYAAQQPLPEGFLEAREAEAAAEPLYKPQGASTYHRPKPLPLVGPDD